jgi:hypothetical protein
MTAAAFDPLLALRTFVDEGVDFIVIGGLAGRVRGSPTITNDLDICYRRDRENLVRLARALQKLQATLRGAPPGLPFQLDAQTFLLGDSFTFETTAGNVDCLATPSGTAGFADLRKNAEELNLGEGLRVLFTTLSDLIRMTKAAGRPKDLIEVEILIAVQEEIARRQR